MLAGHALKDLRPQATPTPATSRREPAGCPERLTFQILVLSFHGLKLIQGFLVGILQFEELGAQGPGLLQRSLQLGLALLALGFPLG